MNRKLAQLLSLSAALAALALAATACGGGNNSNPIIDHSSGSATAHSSTGKGLSGTALVNALANGGFPAVHLSIAHQPGSASVRNGPQLTDAQLNAGTIAEVQVDLGGNDADSSAAYDVFSTQQQAASWSRSFSLAMFNGAYQLHGTSTPTIDGHAAKCEQFKDVSSGRDTGGTQCFAQVGAVVVYGESIIYDSQSGSPADAQALLKAAIENLAAVQSQG